jgi:trigger factor
MIKELKDLSPIRKEVEVEIPTEAVSAQLSEVTAEFARSARVPGFRSGKVPINVVKRKYQKQIQEETLDRLLPKFFYEAVNERELEPVGRPAIKKLDDFAPDRAFTFTAEFEVKPRIELRDFRGLELADPAIDVDGAEVDSVLERLREQSSSMAPVEERGARDGDVVTVDIRTSGEGVEPRDTKEYQVQLGEAAPLPELNEQLFDRRPGETVSFEKSYDDDAPNEEVRGKTVRYEIEIKQLQTIERPELNDELIRSIGLAESLDEAREKIREDLRRHKEQEAFQAKREQASDRLVDMHDVPAPESMIEEELGKTIRNYARYLASQGIDLEYANIDWEKVRNEFRAGAEKRVQRSLILETIARKEEIVVSDTEVDAEIRRASSGSNSDFLEVRHRLKHDGGYDSLRSSLAQERALELVIREAKLVPPAGA